MGFNSGFKRLISRKVLSRFRKFIPFRTISSCGTGSSVSQTPQWIQRWGIARNTLREFAVRETEKFPSVSPIILPKSQVYFSSTFSLYIAINTFMLLESMEDSLNETYNNNNNNNNNNSRHDRHSLKLLKLKLWCNIDWSIPNYISTAILKPIHPKLQLCWQVSILLLTREHIRSTREVNMPVFITGKCVMQGIPNQGFERSASQAMGRDSLNAVLLKQWAATVWMQCFSSNGPRQFEFQ